MSGIGMAITAGLVGVGAYALSSVIGQNAVKDAAAANNRQLNKGMGAVEDATAASQAGLDPYAQAGTDALAQQRALQGLDGPAAQQAAYQQLQNSPQFTAQVQAGEQAINRNASATGGLRGGNNQAALAQFAPQMLNQVVQQQLAQLGGFAQQGQQAAGLQGQFGMQGAGSIADIYGAKGANEAGAALGVAQQQQQAVSGIGNTVTGLIGFGAGPGPAQGF